MADINKLRSKVESLKATISVYERQQAEAYQKLREKFHCRSIPEAIAKGEQINEEIETAIRERDEAIKKAEEALAKVGEI